MRARQFWFLLCALLTGITGAVFLHPTALTASISVVAALLLIASVILIVIRSRQGHRWPFIALPLTLVGSAGIVITLVSARSIRYAILLSVAISIGIYMDALLATRTKTGVTPIPDNRVLYTLGHLALLTVFFASSGMAALSTYLNLPTALIIVIFAWMIYVCGRGFTESVPHLATPERWSIITLLIVSMMQLFVALLTLPFHFIITGGITASVFYCLSGIARTASLGLLNHSIAVRYIAGTTIALTVILATAQWI